MYPSPRHWESKGVLKSLGNNIREKRAWLKACFKIYNNIKDVVRPRGCIEESFFQIYRDAKDPVKMAKLELCTAKALERKASVWKAWVQRYNPSICKFWSWNILLVFYHRRFSSLFLKLVGGLNEYVLNLLSLLTNVWFRGRV